MPRNIVYTATAKKTRVQDALHPFRELDIEAAFTFIDEKGERQAFDLMLTKLSEGDVVYTDSAASLGPSEREMLKKWSEIRERSAHLVCLDSPLLDTRKTIDSLQRESLLDFALSITQYINKSAFAERKRLQREGIDSALKSGVAFGRKRTDFPEDYGKYMNMYHEGKISGSEAAAILGISRSTFYYRARAEEKERERRAKEGVR